jgi:membrane-associated phospholipid phosphatase
VCRTVSIAVPALTVTYGVISLKSQTLKRLDNQIKSNLIEKQYIFHTHLDNYLQFIPVAAAFGMKAFEVENTHKLQDMAIIYTISNLLEAGIVYTIKAAMSRMRPDESTKNSFPSGHTATAFVAAEFLHQEYGHKSAWISVGGYTVATLVGAGRIFNNRHWFSDVVAGAGIGILSTKMVYWAYPAVQKKFRKKKSNNLQSFFYPSYVNGALCLNINYNF